jgi:hypothetical protein
VDEVGGKKLIARIQKLNKINTLGLPFRRFKFMSFCQMMGSLSFNEELSEKQNLAWPNGAST